MTKQSIQQQVEGGMTAHAMQEALELVREYLHHHRMTLPERGTVRLQRVLDAVDEALNPQQKQPHEPFNTETHLHKILNRVTTTKPRPLARVRT